MARTRFCFGPRVAGTALGVLLLLTASSVHADGPAAQARVTALVKAGDLVIVTPWSGERFKGSVIETTACALVLRVATGVRTVPAWEIKTLRSQVPHAENGAARTMAGAAGQCDDFSCLPAAFASLGIGALIQGLDDLGHAPKVIYRAKERLPVADSCTGGLQPGT